MIAALERGVDITPQMVMAVAVAAFLIGVSKGGLGDGLAPVITILIALTVPTEVAVGLLLPILIVGDAFAVWALRGQWDLELVRIILPAAVIGVAGASVFLSSVSGRGVEVVLGIASILFATYRLVAPRLTRGTGQPPEVLGAVAGLASGITSTVAHAGGPPVTLYLVARRTPPITYVATMALVFCVVNWLKVPGYVAADLFDRDLTLALAPTAVLIGPGVLAGRWLVHRIDPAAFERVLIAALFCGGTYLLLR